MQCFTLKILIFNFSLFLTSLIEGTRSVITRRQGSMLSGAGWGGVFLHYFIFSVIFVKGTFLNAHQNSQT